MESETSQFEGALGIYYSEIYQEQNNKYKTFSEKLNKKKDELKRLFRDKLFEVSKMNFEINSKNESSSECRSKESLMNDAKKMKNQIEELIRTMDSLENYVTGFKDRKIDELLKIKEDDFELIINFCSKGYSSDNKAENDNPAGQVPSNACKQCRTHLNWNKYSSYLTSCVSSNNCNEYFRYECKNCLKKFCAACAYPSNIDICGCNKPLEISSVSNHKCDICTVSINETFHRCVSCDYDVCNNCWNRLNKI